MSTFLTPLELEYIDGSDWRVTDPFEYRIGEAFSGEIVRIPEGFITDFASIPRSLWPVLPPTGSYGKAAVVHDWLYQERRVVRVYELYLHHVRYVNRGEADAILKEAMKVLGVGWFTRQTIYFGVRLGGWLAWRNCRKAER